MKFLALLLLAALFCYSSAVPVVPAYYQAVCQQMTKACMFDGQCANGQTDIAHILSHTGLSLQDFITLNPALGQILPSGSLPDNQLICVAGFWQGH